MKIITTQDGSHTLFTEQFDETYHSGKGAIQESQHVFIKAGLQHCIGSPSPSERELEGEEKEVRIFEVGFGTGLNALLTLIEAQKMNLKIHYETIELYPVSLEVIKELNYTQLLENEKFRPPFHSMHLSNWNEEHQITLNFSFKKIHGSVLDFDLSPVTFHLIYFDAFAPETQPEMWTVEVMKKMYDMLMPGGILVSYSSKVTFQRALKEAGFEIEKLPGPPGKREMVRALRK